MWKITTIITAVIIFTDIKGESLNLSKSKILSNMGQVIPRSSNTPVFSICFKVHITKVENLQRGLFSWNIIVKSIHRQLSKAKTIHHYIHTIFVFIK